MKARIQVPQHLGSSFYAVKPKKDEQHKSHKDFSSWLMALDALGIFGLLEDLGTLSPQGFLLSLGSLRNNGFLKRHGALNHSGFLAQYGAFLFGGLLINSD